MASLPMAWNSGLGCPLAGRGGDERGEEAEWVPGCTWVAGELVSSLQGWILWSAGKSLLLVFSH